MGLMNYAINVDPISLCPLKYIDQSILHVEYSLHNLSKKKCMHMLIWNYNGCCFYLERLVLFLCWVISKHG